MARVCPFNRTSGLPVAKIVEGFPDEFRRQWFGTHFFNPPRYMRLLEVIPWIASPAAGCCPAPRRNAASVPPATGTSSLTTSASRALREAGR